MVQPGHEAHSTAPRSGSVAATDAAAFEAAFVTFTQAAQEVQRELRQRLQEGWQSFAAGLAAPQAEAQKVLAEAQQELAAALGAAGAQGAGIQGAGAQGAGAVPQEAADPHAAQSRLVAASVKVNEAARQAGESVQQAAAKLGQDLAGSERQTWDEARGQHEQALRDYVRAFKAAWEQVDPDAFDLRLLAPIGQSLIAVAGGGNGVSGS
jgi:hypothetical protein